MKMFHTLLFIAVIIQGCSHSDCVITPDNTTCYSIESCLYNHLFNTAPVYQPQVRPQLDPYTPIGVEINVNIKSILNLDEKNEAMESVLTIDSTWDDQYLNWDYNDYPVDFMLVKANLVWLPDFTIVNSVTKYFDDTYIEDFKVYINEDGFIEWYYGGIFKTQCSLTLYNYPFDTQTCNIEITNWAYTEELVNLTSGSFSQDGYSENGVWELKSLSVSRTTTAGTPKLTYSVTLARLPSYYILNLILPCVLVTMAALGIFWLPPDCGERLSLGITVLLAYSVFQIVIMDTTPVNSNETPLISRLVIFIMVIVTASLLTAICTMFLHFKRPNARVPRWARRLTFNYMATVFCMKVDVPVDTKGYFVETPKLTEEEVNSDEKTFARNNLKPKEETDDPSLKELRKITAYLDEKERSDFICDEWKMLAAVVDRFFFYFAIVFLLVVALPCVIYAR